MIGQAVGNYRIVEKIGQGGMGEVYKAVDVHLDRFVAVKRLNRDLVNDPALTGRFQAEAKLQAQMNHPNVCVLYCLAETDDDLFMVMEYVEGENVESRLKRAGPIAAHEAVPLMRQALSGIGAAHNSGIIHRDIKPANFIVDRRGTLKVMDFGIARHRDQSRLTRTGVAVGTLNYMSPEQIQGREADVRSDVYALGVTFFEMVTGSLPFTSTSEYEIMQSHVTLAPPVPSAVSPGIPHPLDGPILRALAKSPAQRFQSAEEFSNALAAALREIQNASFSPSRTTVVQGVPARAGAAVEAAFARVQSPAPFAAARYTAANARRVRRDRRLVMWIAAGAALLLVLLGATIFLLVRNSRQLRQTAAPISDPSGIVERTTLSRTATQKVVVRPVCTGFATPAPQGENRCAATVS